MIKFFSNNIAESAVITASTVNAQYPASNIQHDFRTKVFRSTSNADNIVFDLGSIETIDTIAVVDNWKNGFGFSTFTIEANATDVWTSPAFTTTLTVDTAHGIGIKEFTEESYRYWRIVLTSTLGYCELANIFIGKATTITTNGVDYGFSYKSKDLKKASKTRYGQEYIDDIGTQKEVNSLSFKVLNSTELDAIFEVYDDRRTVKPFFMKIGDGTNTIISNENRLNGFYKLKAEPSATITSGPFWEITLSVREQK
jgi:hypothetical protein